jgi:uncharacterized membrane protein YjdF
LFFVLFLTIPSKSKIWPPILIAITLALAALQLHRQGRSWWCNCRGFLWTSDAWGSLNSQTLFDPYSFTHLLHGFMFAGLLLLITRKLPTSWRLCIAIALEAIWEILENTNAVIDRYREATASLGYRGDTVMNSMGDIVCCGVGLIIARKLGWLRSLPIFIVTEIILLFWIRDSLILEIIMLIHPFEVIKSWQLAH